VKRAGRVYTLHGPNHTWNRLVLSKKVNTCTGDCRLIPYKALDLTQESVTFVDVKKIIRQKHDDEHVNYCVIIGKSMHNKNIERSLSYAGIINTK
jgi:hypothetical protein